MSCRGLRIETPRRRCTSWAGVDPSTPRSVEWSGRSLADGFARLRLRRAVMVVDVRIAGNKTLPLEKILPHIHTRKGRPFDLEQIQEDVRRLDHTHLFVDVKTYWQQVPGVGRIVIFDLFGAAAVCGRCFSSAARLFAKKTLQKGSGL